MTTPTDLIAAELARDGSRPFLTYYNDATGERVELSIATTANWVAKTAGYLSDELGLDPGDTVGVILPLHWQSTVIALASWSIGAAVAFGEPGVVTFVEQSNDTPAATAGSPEVVRLSLAPMGADFSRLVAAQPDAFVPYDARGEDLVDATPVDIGHGARVLTVLPYDTPDSVSYGLIAPLAVSGSIVMLATPDPTTAAKHAAVERVNHSLGIGIAEIPRLDH
jgi:uncharacterized protein (TIGR03089 family)